MPIDVDAVAGKEFEPAEGGWVEKDVILYALGLGVGVDAPATDPAVLQYTYEGFKPGFHAVPTFGVIPVFSTLYGTFSIPGFDVDPMMILHGEQSLDVLCDEIPTKANVVTRAKISGVYDKGKGALIVVEATTADKETGKDLFRNEFGIFARGEGGFGGESGPPAGNVAPDRAPDASVETPTRLDQAVLYRLSGDWNPLHVDPEWTQFGGLDRPILHGLCTFGNVGRAVVAAMCDNDPTRFRSIKARFSASVMPGETIITDMWKESDTDIIVSARLKERDAVVVKNSRVTISA